nr:immunoglobulin light chain junction region [Macaca mulatta]MOX80017.1 immunoglobulin light chain junction region [Macaca mulatta]
DYYCFAYRSGTTFLF